MTLIDFLEMKRQNLNLLLIKFKSLNDVLGVVFILKLNRIYVFILIDLSI